jgi:hypothetical protein
VTLVLAVAQTLNELLVRFGVTVKLIEALAPGVSGFAAEIPSAAALQFRVVVVVLVQPAGTFLTVSLVPSCAVSSRVGFGSLVGTRFVMLAVIVVDLPAWI